MRIALMGALVLALAAAARPATAGGPYRGRVVDAVTGRPLAGALVWIVWQRSDERAADVWATIGTREAQTGAGGDFVVNEFALEPRHRPGAVRARFLFFAHGYMTLPEDPAADGLPADRFSGTGGVVALRPAVTAEERVRSFNTTYASLTRIGRTLPSPPAPDDPQPMLLGQFVRDELQALGFDEKTTTFGPGPARDVQLGSGDGAASANRGAESSRRWGPPEQYLQPGGGRYRGCVVDAETTAPIAGAVVLVIWRRNKEELLRFATVFHDAREAITDASGEWSVDAVDLERRAADHTLRPTFEMFAPGYAVFRTSVIPEVRRDFGAGVTIELRPLRTRKERLRNLLELDHGMVPDEKNVAWRKAINAERQALGLDILPLVRQP